MSHSENKIVSAFLSYRDVLVKALVRLSVQPADVDDILQESLARSLEADEKSPIEYPKSYLYAVARNIVFEQQKRQSREVQWEIDEASLESNAAPTDDEFHYRRMMEAFWEAMATLPKAHQRAILLRRIYGLSHKEIARKMGVSISSVEKYFAKGIKRCQDVMSGRGYGVDPIDRKSTSVKGQATLNMTDGRGRSHE